MSRVFGALFLVFALVPNLGLAQNPIATDISAKSLAEKISEIERLDPKTFALLNHSLSNHILELLVFAAGHGLAEQILEEMEKSEHQILENEKGRRSNGASGVFAVATFMEVVAVYFFRTAQNRSETISALGSGLLGGFSFYLVSLGISSKNDLEKNKIQNLADIRKATFHNEQVFDFTTKALNLTAQEQASVREAWVSELASENSHRSLADILIDSTDAKGEPVLLDWQIRGLNELEKMTQLGNLEEAEVRPTEREKFNARLHMIGFLKKSLLQFRASKATSDQAKNIDRTLDNLNLALTKIDLIFSE